MSSRLNMPKIESFIRWYKHLQLKQQTGFVIAAFSLLILPIALFASQKSVNNQSKAADPYGQTLGAPCKTGLPCKTGYVCENNICVIKQIMSVQKCGPGLASCQLGYACKNGSCVKMQLTATIKPSPKPTLRLTSSPRPKLKMTP